MRTNPISTPIPKEAYVQKPSAKAKETEGKSAVEPSVALETHKDEQFGTYKVDGKRLAELKNDHVRQTETFKAMVRAMIEKQGYAVSDVLKALDQGESPVVLVDEATQLEAQANIADDGYWGVEQTANRILDFAKAVSGNDPSKIDMMIGAFKQGFEEAKKAFGGTLPDISQKTYDRVMEGFDAWRKE